MIEGIHMQAHSDDLHYSRTSVYSLQYHLIIVTKYRRDVLTGSVKQELEALLRSLADPKHSISSIMKGLKGVSARMLFMHHPEIKQKLWGGHLWQPSYFAVTVSERSEEQIRHYIQHQKPSKGKTR
jgi:putative transposase